MLALEWRPRAQLDRESIAIYLGLERQQPDVALRVIQELDAAIDTLREMPGAGRRLEIPELSCHDYRRYTCGSYYIYYRYNDEVLTVCRLLHQRQDIDVYTLVEGV